MPPEDSEAALRAAVLACLEGIVDPCSVAAGARAGLVSMGLVGEVSIEHGASGARLDVVLHVTEPTCLMGAIFETTAARELAALPGVEHVVVRLDRTHLWSPSDMSAAYRQRLDSFRAAQFAHQEDVRRKSGQTKGSVIR